MCDGSRDDLRGLKRSLILLLFLSFCLYFPTLFHDAFADDDIYLAYANRFLREAEWFDLYQLLLKPANPWEFLPVRDLSYWLDFRLYGDNPNGFHATNLIWYGFSGAASFWMFKELVLLSKPSWAARATVLSLCGALIFVVHPAHVEVVAWIASRKDLLAGALGFLSVALLARALRTGWPWQQMTLAVLLLFLACFGKAAAMTFVLFDMVMIGWCWAGSPEVSRIRKLGYLSLFCGVVVLAFAIHLNVGESTGIRIENHVGAIVMLERASRISSALLGILLFPYPLHFYYDVYQLGEWYWAVSASAILLLIVSLVVLTRKPSIWALGVVLSLSPMVVYLQLIPFTTWSLASERFVFVPVAGLALLLIDLLGRISNPGRIGACLLAIVIPSAMIVWARVDDWEDGRQMLVREYDLQPGFHNAIRDRIRLKLLPESRFVEASELARQVSRPYAVDALVSLIRTEQAYRNMSESKVGMSGNVEKELRRDFCLAIFGLRSALARGYAQMLYEPDVSYNNILRTLDSQLKDRYGSEKAECKQSLAR